MRFPIQFIVAWCLGPQGGPSTAYPINWVVVLRLRRYETRNFQTLQLQKRSRFAFQSHVDCNFQRTFVNSRPFSLLSLTALFPNLSHFLRLRQYLSRRLQPRRYHLQQCYPLPLGTSNCCWQASFPNLAVTVAGNEDSRNKSLVRLIIAYMGFSSVLKLSKKQPQASTQLHALVRPLA
jgi:hypothetical protein